MRYKVVLLPHYEIPNHHIIGSYAAFCVLAERGRQGKTTARKDRLAIQQRQLSGYARLYCTAARALSTGYRGPQGGAAHLAERVAKACTGRRGKHRRAAAGNYGGVEDRDQPPAPKPANRKARLAASTLRSYVWCGKNDTLTTETTLK